jgi:hypothetical protein
MLCVCMKRNAGRVTPLNDAVLFYTMNSIRFIFETNGFPHSSRTNEARFSKRRLRRLLV